MNLPNILTLSRIILSPVFIAFFMIDTLWAKIVCLVLILSFLATDFLDGYFARKSNLVSDAGKLLDPLADKISNFSVFLCFLIYGYAHIWMIIAIFYRDALVNLLRVFAAAKNVIISARWSGKVKTALQGVAIVMVLVLIVYEKSMAGNGANEARVVSQSVQLWSNWIMGIVAAVTALSLIDYVKANWEIIRKI